MWAFIFTLANLVGPHGWGGESSESGKCNFLSPLFFKVTALDLCFKHTH